MSVTGLVALIGLGAGFLRWAYPGPSALELPASADGRVHLHCQVLRESGDPRTSARWGDPVPGRLEVGPARLVFTPADGGAGWQAAIEDVVLTRLNPEGGIATPSLDVRIVGVGARRLRVSDRPIRRFTIDHTTTRHEALASRELHDLLIRRGARPIEPG